MQTQSSESPSWKAVDCGDVTDSDRRNQRRFAAWALAWALSFVAASFILASEEVAGAAAWIVALVPTAIGAAAVWAYVTFIRQADELLRKIHLEALALGFGAGALFMLSYRLFERAGAPDLDVSDPLLVMVLVWVAAQLVLNRRYA